jgi:hypothetical protein
LRKRKDGRPDQAHSKCKQHVSRINGLWYQEADAARAFVNQRKPTGE